MTNIGIKERRVDTVTILDADSNLRFALRFGASTVSLPSAIQSLLEEDQSQILLNLEGVVRIDARSLGQVVSAHVSVSKKGGRMKLLHLTERVRELMMTAKLLTVFEIFEDESKAVDSFKGDLFTPALESALSA